MLKYGGLMPLFHFGMAVCKTKGIAVAVADCALVIFISLCLFCEDYFCSL
jgi:hypothetical protein